MMVANTPEMNGLKDARKRAGLTLAQLGDKLGVSEGAVSKYENEDQRLTLPLMRKAAKVLGCSLAEIAGEGADDDHADPKSDHMAIYSGNLSPGVVPIGGTDFTSIGRYDASFSAGNGSLIDPNAEPLGYHLVETSWLRAITTAAPEHLAIVRVDGDSMENTLFNGDWVLVDKTQTRFGREGIYALGVGEVTWIKRLSLNLRDKLITIMSDNARYRPQDLPEEDLTIIGRVVWIVARRL